MSGPIVILGGGLAGHSLVRELRKLQPAAAITLVAADSADFYSKPNLSNALAQQKAPAALVASSAGAVAKQHGLDLFARVRVLGIDRSRKRLLTAAGEIAYGTLVLALGADPIRLDLAGDAADQVLSVNDLEDYARFRDQLAPGARVAILGAGLIGCEFANDLAQAGHGVAVIDPSDWPLSALLPQAAGRSLIEPLAALGVAWHFGTTVSRVDRTGAGLRLTLSDGCEVDAALVLSAVGLRPRTAMAREAGLDTAAGIVVDEFLRTSDPEIFALGDCAQVLGRVRPYVAPLLAGARALAATLSGRPTAVSFPPQPVLIKTPACPVVVAPVARDALGTWQAVGSAEGVHLEFHDAEGRLHGYALTGAATAAKGDLLKRLIAAGA